MFDWNKIHSRDVEYKALNNIFLDKLLFKSEELTGHTPATIIDLGCGNGEYLEKFI